MVAVAQSVEQRIVVPRVTSSSLVSHPKNFKGAEFKFSINYNSAFFLRICGRAFTAGLPQREFPDAPSRHKMWGICGASLSLKSALNLIIAVAIAMASVTISAYPIISFVAHTTASA